MLCIRKDIIRAFKRAILSYIDGVKVHEESDKELDENNYFKDIENESEGINYDFFEKHFSNITPTVLAKTLFETKDENKNNDLANAIKSGLRHLKDETDKMSEDETEI